jgi:hypothetical protein
VGAGVSIVAEFVVWSVGSKVVAAVPRVDSVGVISAWVLMAAAAVPVSNTATSANAVPNFDFMS